MVHNIAIGDNYCNPPNEGVYRHSRLTAKRRLRYKRDMKLRLKELRTERGLTQQVVSDAVGISQGYYAELERGSKQINQRRIEAFAKFYGVDPREIIDSGGESGTPDAVTERLRRLHKDDLAMVEVFLDGLIARRSRGE